MKKKILICGATGFIGRNIAESLAHNDEYEVYGTYGNKKPFSSERIAMIQADLTSRDDVQKVVQGMDIVIQAAATTSGAKDIVTKPYYHVTDNAVMNALIFRAAFEHKVKQVVFFSCTVMYQPSETPVKESDFDANDEMLSEYFGVGWTKVYIEKMCQFYSRLGTTNYTVLRHSNIYGPHDKYDLEKSHVFGASVTKVMRAQKDSAITIWGSGEEKRDFLYIDDLVRCVQCALKQQKTAFELFNVGSGRAVSVKELVSEIIKISGKNLTITHDISKPNIKTSLCLDCEKIKVAFSWQPQVSLTEGIEKTLEWYKKNIL